MGRHRQVEKRDGLMLKMTKEQKAAEEKVSKLFAQNCSGIQIPIMKPGADELA